jgi:hypothetical protein
VDYCLRLGTWDLVQSLIQEPTAQIGALLVAHTLKLTAGEVSMDKTKQKINGVQSQVVQIHFSIEDPVLQDSERRSNGTTLTCSDSKHPSSAVRT